MSSVKEFYQNCGERVNYWGLEVIAGNWYLPIEKSGLSHNLWFEVVDPNNPPIKDLLRIFADPTVRINMSDNMHTPEGVEAYFGKPNNYRGGVRWMIRLGEEVIGTCSLKNLSRDKTGLKQIYRGIEIMEPWQSQGIGGVTSRVLMGLALKLGVSVVKSEVAVTNQKSMGNCVGQFGQPKAYVYYAPNGSVFEGTHLGAVDDLPGIFKSNDPRRLVAEFVWPTNHFTEILACFPCPMAGEVNYSQQSYQ